MAHLRHDSRRRADRPALLGAVSVLLYFFFTLKPPLHRDGRFFMIVGLMPHSDLLFPDLPPELFVHGQPQTSGVGRLALLPEDAGQVMEQPGG